MTKKITLVTSAFRSERYLKCYFENMLSLNNLESIQFVLVLNEPTDTERELAASYKRFFPDNLKIVTLDKRESIGASTNRGYRMANTEYVTYADVDDYRLPDCYERLLKTLEDDSDADFAYGDFVEVRAQGETTGTLIQPPEFDPKKFARGSFVGPNHFFRRSLLYKCGYWDEQLRSGGDFDFQVRAAFNCKFKKTPGLMCYYTNYPNSGSASSNILQPIERTVIELRYGLYDMTDKLGGYPHISGARKYRINHILLNGEWHPLEKYVPNYRQILKEKQELKKKLERRYPYKITKYYLSKPFKFIEQKSRDVIRMLLTQLGLLERLRAFRGVERRNF